jgi:hypothetical protein
VIRDAELDATRTYRYTLYRAWSGAPGRVLWVMLNPSKADENDEDPTIRRCIGYSTAWGYGSLTVCNLFALVSTDPGVLWSHPDPVGPENLEAIQREVIEADFVILAWGAFQQKRVREQAVVTFEVVRSKDPHCLAIAKDGHPKHPLYLAATLKPVAWPGLTFRGLFLRSGYSCSAVESARRMASISSRSTTAVPIPSQAVTIQLSSKDTCTRRTCG